MDKVVEIIKDKKNLYLIKEGGNGFYAEVRPLSRFKYMCELISDYFGNTSKHPQFAYYDSIDSVRWKIRIHGQLING